MWGKGKRAETKQTKRNKAKHVPREEKEEGRTKCEATKTPIQALIFVSSVSLFVQDDTRHHPLGRKNNKQLASQLSSLSSHPRNPFPLPVPKSPQNHTPPSPAPSLTAPLFHYAVGGLGLRVLGTQAHTISAVMGACPEESVTCCFCLFFFCVVCVRWFINGMVGKEGGWTDECGGVPLDIDPPRTPTHARTSTFPLHATPPAHKHTHNVYK